MKPYEIQDYMNESSVLFDHGILFNLYSRVLCSAASPPSHFDVLKRDLGKNPVAPNSSYCITYKQ